MEKRQTEPLEDWLHRYGLARGRMRTALAHATGMTETDLDALEYLEADGPLTQREMGDRLLLTSGAITMLVDRLEQAGWVRRRPHPADRRATLIELTAQAVDGAPPGLRNFHTRLEQAAASVEPAHRQALTEFLRGVAQATNQAADELRGQR